ncbi:MAG TPA: HAMP domain-containing sensor histidine kinase [Rhodanobacteraceae bacterium]|nr:HAMP domain-containing sensor histidine kinase [Rhodanobacteraceae bacterium]
MNAHEAMVEESRAGEIPGVLASGSKRNGDHAAYSGESGNVLEAHAESHDQILGSLVHSVSNSLNSIMSASQLANLLIRQRKLGEARASLDRLEEECLRAARLLRGGRGLAALKLPESSGVDVFALLSVCAEACADLGDVRLVCGKNLPLVCGQADALKRMFVEILDNAFQFGARNVEVGVEADHSHEVVRIRFTDDGPGVQYRSVALFEPFVTSEPAEHNGLGLAFAKQIAAAYGGAIGLGESSSGAVFWIWLPFSAPSLNSA